MVCRIISGFAKGVPYVCSAWMVLCMYVCTYVRMYSPAFSYVAICLLAIYIATQLCTVLLVYILCEVRGHTTETSKMCEKHVCLYKPKCINAAHVNRRYTHAVWAKHNTHGSLRELCGNNLGTFDSTCYSEIIPKSFENN